MPVDSVREDYNKMLPKWKRLRDCSHGRDAMVKAGNLYVPDLPGADNKGNEAYRSRGNFYNAVSRTVQGMNGAIFQESPEVEFPKQFAELLNDITLTNIPFESFATEAGKEIMLMARYGVLIDLPPADSGDVRPYLLGYKAEDIINWKTERMGGDDVLTMVVLKETVENENDPDKDEFSCTTVTQYRVVSLVDGKCQTQLYRESEKDSKKFVPYLPPAPAMRRGVALDFVPFVFLGAVMSTPDIELPPLIDLADVSIAYWRNSVDHEYGLHLVALPTPWRSGAKGGGDGAVRIGPAVVWELELQGSAGMLEFSGKGLEALVTAMDDKKKQMATLGARLLEDTPTTSETASAVRMRHSAEHATLRTCAQSIEQGFKLILQTVAWWAGYGSVSSEPKDLTDIGVELNKEYLDVKATPQEVQVMLTALQAGEVSFETWYAFLQTGGWAREGVDAEMEKAAIKNTALEPPTPDEDIPLNE